MRRTWWAVGVVVALVGLVVVVTIRGNQASDSPTTTSSTPTTMMPTPPTTPPPLVTTTVPAPAVAAGDLASVCGSVNVTGALDHLRTALAATMTPSYDPDASGPVYVAALSSLFAQLRPIADAVADTDDLARFTADQATVDTLAAALTSKQVTMTALTPTTRQGLAEASAALRTRAVETYAPALDAEPACTTVAAQLRQI